MDDAVGIKHGHDFEDEPAAQGLSTVGVSSQEGQQASHDPGRVGLAGVHAGREGHDAAGREGPALVARRRDRDEGHGHAGQGVGEGPHRHAAPGGGRGAEAVEVRLEVLVRVGEAAGAVGARALHDGD